MALLLALVAPAGVQAQQGAVITGTVKSEFGDPIQDANVYIVELAISVGTNAAGKYTINIPGDRVRGQALQLRSRAISFKADAKPITISAGTQTIDFTLAKDVNRLQEIVTTGVTVGTEVKKLAFSVAQVSEADMPVPGSNPLSQLQGKVAGATIVSNTGRPGSAPAIVLRGPQSINASGRGQEPLYIIDGVVSQGGLQDINPQDIENIEIVKGAAAASLYGSRAGNGVIQITTRSGKNQGEGVRFRAYAEYGQSDIENEYRYPKTSFLLMDETMSRYCVVISGAQDCSRTVDIYQEAYRINNDGVDFALAPVTLQNDGGIARNPGDVRARTLFQTNPFPKTYNPIQQFLSNGESINATVDATGRVGRTNFFASVNQLQSEGSVKLLPGYMRNSLRLNLDQQLGGNINFSLRSSYSNAKDYNSGSAFFSLSRQPVNAELFSTDSKGRLYIRSVAQQQGAQNTNPAYNSQNFQPVNRIDRFVGSLDGRWAPLSWLDVNSTFGYDERNNFQEWQQDRGYRTTAASSTNLGENRRSAGRSTSMNASINVAGRRNWFDDALTSRLTLRYLYEAQEDRGQEARGSNLAVPGLTDADAAITRDFYSSYIERVRQLGAFANLDLDYKGRYIVGALVRRDAASLFGSAQRWKTYGRGSLAWRLSDEPWFGFDDQITDLKFRVSRGTAGNRPRYSAQYETFTIGAGGALNPNTLGNKNLRPEVSTETEYGMDLELFSRYGLTLTYANNVINDQILNPPPSAATGFLAQWQNVGELTNKTFEASLNVPIIQRRDVEYSARVNYDRTTSTISRLDVPEFFYSANDQQGTDQMFKIVQGGRFGAIYGRRFVEECNELPADFQSKCGAGLDYQKNSDGLIVYTGAGNTVNDGITKNLWTTRLAQGAGPWGQFHSDNIAWGMPILKRNERGVIDQYVVGNALPDFKFSVSQNFRFKRVTVYGLLDATIGKDVFNEMRQWSFGDFMNKDADQAGMSVTDAKPLGYYFRAQSTGGIGGLYDVLGPNNVTVEDASFAKVRELSVGYRIGAIRGFGNWSANLIGRNLKTFTKYKGFDPEVGLGGGNLGSGVLNAVDIGSFPNLRTFTFSLSTSF